MLLSELRAADFFLFRSWDCGHCYVLASRGQAAPKHSAPGFNSALNKSDRALTPEDSLRGNGQNFIREILIDILSLFITIESVQFR